MIDFTDPAQMTHHDKPIPINVLDKFEATREAARAVYAASGREWDADADQQLERRVLSGMTTEQIVAETLQDRKARFDE
jgi:hypothetical protein